MPKKIIEIVSEIVQMQVSSSPMTAADITSSLRQVFSTLQELQRVESGETKLSAALEPAHARALTPEDSIQENKIICLECGAEMKWLTRKHLVAHGMDQREYRKKYGFTMQTPLAAKSLTKAWRKAGKKRGLPEKLQQYMEAQRQAKANSPAQATTTQSATMQGAAINTLKTKLRKKRV